ncbi:glycosyltransferase family 9 protein [Massilia sp. G4R7]|uniref:Glycosyltransferase family 9 protein n=1 Tax=Massilia phyllostachyos TaxID=2898585 RepID=A0ABS8Q8A2_9BURK|nr:glycosyltransferase family 9 protein [Massilia phyllostachyos]MCD2517999.1 glycosyltransferase family 9 protein [Massilia phyllostachyos]
MKGRSFLQRHDVRSAIVFRALELGDMLCAVPALRALRAALPAARIVLAGLPWMAQFVQRFSSYLDDFVAFPGHPLLPGQATRHDDLPGFYAGVRKQGFDLALQLHDGAEVSNHIVSFFGARAMAGFARDTPSSSNRTLLLPYPGSGTESERLLHLCERLGAPAAGRHFEFPLRPGDLKELEDSQVAPGLATGSYLCIHPGAGGQAQCWPPERFATVADQLHAEFRLATVLTGGRNDAPLARKVAEHMRSPAIEAAAPISIGAMAALMSRSRLLVCSDTGIAHIAAGLGLNSVVVSGKADIARWAPPDRLRHRCIWDPGAERGAVVLEHARALLTGTAPSGQRAAGMWPYW